MTCLIAIVAGACLLDPSQIEVHADFSTQVSGNLDYQWDSTDYHGGHIGLIQLSAGGDLTPSWSVSYGIRHTSLTNTSRDRGEERAFIGLTWRPFGSR